MTNPTAVGPLADLEAAYPDPGPAPTFEKELMLTARNGATVHLMASDTAGQYSFAYRCTKPQQWSIGVVTRTGEVTIEGYGPRQHTDTTTAKRVVAAAAAAVEPAWFDAADHFCATRAHWAAQQTVHRRVRELRRDIEQAHQAALHAAALALPAATRETALAAIGAGFTGSVAELTGTATAATA